ncbi:MAG: UDP-N-acetylmuramate dehydrogenase [Bacteroidota bacterium]
MTPPPFFRQNVALAPLTTIGLGGSARLFATCTSVDQLRAALRYVISAGVPLQVFSGGSNVIFADEGFDGCILHVDLRGINVSQKPGEVIVRAAAGEPWDLFVARATEHGWGGVECLSGIPGSVGATPVQNVGAYGQEVAETITGIRALDVRTLKEISLSPEECGFSYRRSRFKGEGAGRFIITEVEYSLRPDAPAVIRYEELRRSVETAVDLSKLRPGTETLTAIRGAVIALRKSKSMVIDPTDENSRSVGSFYTNPVLSEGEFRQLQERWRASGGSASMPKFPSAHGIKVPAAWLVEHAGFSKGFRRGGAGISSNHALALVNRGGTTRELMGLAEEIREAVFATFGVRLEYEPVIVPFRP